jgi:hypothetical protein
MRGYLKEYPGAFDPDEIRILVAHSTKHGSPLRPAEPSSTWTPGLKLRGRYLRNILLRPLSTASVTKDGYATVLKWP